MNVLARANSLSREAGGMFFTRPALTLTLSQSGEGTDLDSPDATADMTRSTMAASAPSAGNRASASAPHNCVSCRKRSRQSEHVSICRRTSCSSSGDRQPAAARLIGSAQVFAGMMEIIHGLLSRVSLDEVKRFTARFICRNFSSA